MTYLQLCQRIHLLLGMGSRGNTAKPGTVPTAVSGQVDELAEIVEWAKLAWRDVQIEYPWGWLVAQGTLAFGAGTDTVVPNTTLTNYREWIPFVEPYGMGSRKYVLSYITSAGSTAEQKVYFEDWDTFRGFRDRADVATGRPVYFTIKPDHSWQVYPTPDVSYTLRFDYLYKPKIFTTSDGAVNIEDYPSTGRGLPEEFQDAIVWRAIRYWAETRGDANMFQIADRRYRELMQPIKRRYRPKARFG